MVYTKEDIICLFISGLRIKPEMTNPTCRISPYLHLRIEKFYKRLYKMLISVWKWGPVRER